MSKAKALAQHQGFLFIRICHTTEGISSCTYGLGHQDADNVWCKTVRSHGTVVQLARGIAPYEQIYNGRVVGNVQSYSHRDSVGKYHNRVPESNRVYARQWDY